MTGLGKAFDGIQDARVGAQVPKAPAPRLVPTPRAAVATRLAKSVDTDFEPVKIYIRKQTRKAAARKWEDADGGDFSELVEKLLREYLGT